MVLQKNAKPTTLWGDDLACGLRTCCGTMRCSENTQQRRGEAFSQNGTPAKAKTLFT